MGTFLDSYGDDSDTHEGYVAEVLGDGSLTTKYNEDTEPRMVGQVVAACGCGWIGSIRYPTTESFDEAEDRALIEWERDHARPALESLQADNWDRLRTMVRRLAGSHALITRSRFGELTPSGQRDLLDRTVTALDRASELARRLRAPLDTPDGLS